MRSIVLTGSAGSFHERLIPEGLAEPEVWLFEPTGRSLVLGSAQHESVADLEAAAGADVDVVRRRSGGGAVYVDPARCLWLDVVVPPSSPLWSDDVRASTHWLGAAWVRALATIGIDGQHHTGGLETTPWSRLVCYAALGPGEVVIDGRKAVGISQRRTRAGARFQCIAYDHWDPRDVLDLLEMPTAQREHAATELADVATGVGDSLGKLRDAIITELVGSGSMH